MDVNELEFWEVDPEAIEQIYTTRDNYQVEEVGNGNICYIFFSSHSLYYPNTIEEFDKEVVKKDKFEWKKMAHSKQVLARAGRIIYLRDIYKVLYAKGINSTADDVDKTAQLLRELTKGYEGNVVVVGSCGGGYAALLFGSLINAKQIFCFSGPADISQAPTVKKYFDKKVEGGLASYKYANICDVLRQSQSQMYYFYPAYGEVDLTWVERMMDVDTVKKFAFNQHNHAATMMHENMRYIICKDSDYMARLHQRYAGTIINFITFFFKTTPVTTWIPSGFREFSQMMKRRLKNG